MPTDLKKSALPANRRQTAAVSPTASRLEWTSRVMHLNCSLSGGSQATNPGSALTYSPPRRYQLACPGAGSTG
jgi:hypothetical protein